MDADRRAKIISESLANLQRFAGEQQLESDELGDWAMPPGASEAQPAATHRAAGAPSIDPVEQWRCDMEAIERSSAEGREQLRRQERRDRREHERQQTADFWQAIDERIAAAVEVERERTDGILTAIAKSVADYAETVDSVFVKIDERCTRLQQLLDEVNRNSAASAEHTRRARDLLRSKEERRRVDEGEAAPPVVKH